MESVRSLAVRQFVAAVVLVVLALSGVGREMAVADAAPQPLVGWKGMAVAICHSGTGEPSGPAVPRHTDCCDACALCAPVSLPESAPLTAPAHVEYVAEHADALRWVPAVARVPTPRLSQGPPAA